jgi:hypothetical protein
VARLRLHIAENILTLRCPYARCRRAFVDYDGCNALRCSACSGYFCALCLTESPTDYKNHAHLLQACPFVPPGEADRLFNVGLFRDVQHRRRAARLRAYLLAVVAPHLRTPLLRAMRRDLVDLGLGPLLRDPALASPAGPLPRALRAALRAAALAAAGAAALCRRGRGSDEAGRAGAGRGAGAWRGWRAGGALLLAGVALGAAR